MQVAYNVGFTQVFELDSCSKRRDQTSILAKESRGGEEGQGAMSHRST